MSLRLSLSLAGTAAAIVAYRRLAKPGNQAETELRDAAVCPVDGFIDISPENYGYAIYDNRSIFGSGL